MAGTAKDIYFNTTGKAASTTDASNFKNLLDIIYPVGSYYISNLYNATSKAYSPSILFGGTWSQVTNRFLYGSSLTAHPNAAANYLGGSTSHQHTLTSDGAYAMLDITNTGDTSSESDLLLSLTSRNVQWSTIGTQGADPMGVKYAVNPPYGFTEIDRKINSDGSYRTRGLGVQGYTDNNNDYLPPYRLCFIWYRTA